MKPEQIYWPTIMPFVASLLQFIQPTLDDHAHFLEVLIVEFVSARTKQAATRVNINHAADFVHFFITDF